MPRNLLVRRRATLLGALAFGTALSAQRAPDPKAPIQAEMRHVDFHIDSMLVLRIEYLRGVLLPTGNAVPYFDDKRSFLFSIDSARIIVGQGALSQLLNRYVFAYRGSPIRDLRISIKDGQVVQHAVAHGIGVTTVNRVSVTPEGEIRLHPTSIDAAGIPVGGALRLFHMRLSSFVDLSGARGVRFEGDDLVLTVSQLLPPPGIRGRVADVSVRDTDLVQVFRPAGGAKLAHLAPPDANAPNYMYYRDGVLRFGRLTMTGVDLQIVDEDPADWFDFYLDRYNQQLVQGYSRTTPSHGLIAVMPDFHAPSEPSARATAPPASEHGRKREHRSR